MGAHIDDLLEPEKESLSGAPTWSPISGTLSSSASWSFVNRMGERDRVRERVRSKSVSIGGRVIDSSSGDESVRVGWKMAGRKKRMPRLRLRRAREEDRPALLFRRLDAGIDEDEVCREWPVIAPTTHVPAFISAPVTGLESGEE